MNLWNVCTTHSYILTWYIVIKFGDLRVNKYTTSTYFTEKGYEDYSRCSPQVSFRALVIILKFLSCENIFKYLIGRLMYRIYHGELSVLHCLFTKNSDIHVHNTRQKCHYHMPLCRTNLGKCGLRYVGASVWNSILSVNINPNVSEFIFSRSLKGAICDSLL